MSNVNLSGTKQQLIWEVVNQGAEGRDLHGADLRQTNLSQANLVRTDLSRANLWGPTY